MAGVFAKDAKIFNDMMARIFKGAKEAVNQSAKNACADAIRFAPEGEEPRREPRLKSSIDYKCAAKGLRIEGVVRADNPHAAFVEFGTGRRGAGSSAHPGINYDSQWPGMAAQPYMQTAFDRNRDEFVKMCRENVKRALGGRK